MTYHFTSIDKSSGRPLWPPCVSCLCSHQSACVVWRSTVDGPRACTTPYPALEGRGTTGSAPSLVKEGLGVVVVRDWRGRHTQTTPVQGGKHTRKHPGCNRLDTHCAGVRRRVRLGISCRRARDSKAQRRARLSDRITPVTEPARLRVDRYSSPVAGSARRILLSNRAAGRKGLRDGLPGRSA